MSKYKPETKWTSDGNLVYNLHQDGWKKGEPIMVNDVAIQIQATHLSDDEQAKIAGIIKTALNEEYF